jgi:hypothetical protein
MVGGEMMNKKDLFEKYFKLDFLTLVNDPTDNVRVTMGRILRHHFVTESFGAFVYDEEMNDAVRLLKKDECQDVRDIVSDINTYDTEDGQDLNVNKDYFGASIFELSKGLYNDEPSELEIQIENDIVRHNSEDFIDRGNVLESYRIELEI